MRVAYKPYKYVKSFHQKKEGRGKIPAFTAMMNRKQAVAGLLLGGGSIMLILVVLPIVSWQITGSKTQELIFPLAAADANQSITKKQTQNSLVLGLGTQTTPVTHTQALPQQQPVEVHQVANNTNVQLAKLSDGFSYFTIKSAPLLAQLSEFSVTIPKLGIANARTVVYANDFDTHLAHLPGTALPGDIGNVFITGHSALPRFYSPTNYKTIFTHLTDLDIFDEIQVDVEGKLYRYQVEKRTVVDPTDISVIEPPDQYGKYLTLMTCVPPGLNTKRLIVLARLVE